jgi:predicted alpha/beta hydrolase family esterase
MTKTLIVPGLDGSPAPHWQHWWAATDPRALLVDLSNPSRPTPAVWETELASVILHHPDCVLVGHSLGAVLVARILTKWPQLKVRAALLVAPAETSGSDRIGQFGPIPERPLHVPTTVIASRNDPWMTYARATGLACAWDAEIVDLGFAGHINVDAGYGPWAGGKWHRDELIRKTAPRPQIQISQRRTFA